MSLRDRLRRLRREEEPQPAPDEQLPGCTLGPPEDLVRARGAAGEWLARHTRFERSHRHGDFSLAEIEGVEGMDLTLLSGDTSLAELDLEDVLYLDTETTGLSGGAGTYVFMVGLGSFEVNDGKPFFECWQGFLDGPGDEPALLEECARRIRRSAGVVSFFGKSFDRHRLQDKMRQCGVDPPFEGLAHLDLYHPCRRLYREAYGDGRLKTLEYELCAVEREDDLPGARAPAAWFDYQGRRPHQLEAVFRHNLDDVLSLVTLAAHLGRSRRETRRDGRPLSGDPATRALGLSRSSAGSGDRQQALVWLDLALERGAGPRRTLELERADLLRLTGQAPPAMEAYRALASGPEDACSVPALLELSKLLEHHRRSFTDALECCLAAASLLERTHSGLAFARLKRDLDKRTSRLRCKTSGASRSG